MSHRGSNNDTVWARLVLHRYESQVAVWDFGKVYERTVWRMNRALTNNLSFLPSVDGMSCCSASSDGTLKVLLCLAKPSLPRQSLADHSDSVHCVALSSGCTAVDLTTAT